MKKLLGIVCFLLMLFLVIPAYANLEYHLDGSKVGGTAVRGLYSGDISITGQGRDKTVVIAPDGGMEVEVVSTTSKTLAATDKPKRIIMTANGDNVVTLPVAADGLIFQVIDGDISAAGAGGAELIYIHPNGSDQIIYAPTGAAAGLDGGDVLVSTGNTGDSVTLIGQTGVWYIDMGVREWTDGGAGNR